MYVNNSMNRGPQSPGQLFPFRTFSPRADPLPQPQYVLIHLPTMAVFSVPPELDKGSFLFPLIHDDEFPFLRLRPPLCEALFSGAYRDSLHPPLGPSPRVPSFPAPSLPPSTSQGLVLFVGLHILGPFLLGLEPELHRKLILLISLRPLGRV